MIWNMLESIWACLTWIWPHIDPSLFWRVLFFFKFVAKTLSISTKCSTYTFAENVSSPNFGRSVLSYTAQRRDLCFQTAQRFSQDTQRLLPYFRRSTVLSKPLSRFYLLSLSFSNLPIELCFHSFGFYCLSSLDSTLFCHFKLLYLLLS